MEALPGSAGLTVALPEARQLDVLAGLLERRNATVLRCPLVAILDTPDRQSVIDWISRFIVSPPALLILYTGEGVRRIAAVAESAAMMAPFTQALASTQILTRGAKPVRELRLLGIRPGLEAAEPTTAGVIETLRNLNLDGTRVCVQLYGQEPVPALMDLLRERGCEPDTVAPYIYASASDDEQVLNLIDRIRIRDVDAIAFTSKGQVSRLMQVAAAHALSDSLRAALGGVKVAAVGPVVAAELERHGIRIDVIPERGFFMKPLVTRLMDALT